MTDELAAREARRRWGQEGWVDRYPSGVHTVGRLDRLGYKLVLGRGDTWEQAFDDAETLVDPAAATVQGTAFGGWIALLIVTLLTSSSLTSERIDFFDATGRRTGYGLVDRETGRVDFFDTRSRRRGWGTMGSTGRLERFDPRGRRLEPAVIPPQRQEPFRRP